MLFAALELWELVATILGAGGIGAAAQWVITYLGKRQEWRAADDDRTVNAWKDYAKKKDEDIAQIRKEQSQDRMDTTERLRALERKEDRAVRRHYWCERRWEMAEQKIEDLQFAIDRYNDALPTGQPKLVYRKHTRPAVVESDDDSQLEENNASVHPHGPVNSQSSGDIQI